MVIWLSRIVLKFLSFISFYLVVRALSLGDFGFITLALSISGPVLGLSGLGLDDLVFAHGARMRGENKAQEFWPLFGGFCVIKAVVTFVIIGMLFFVRSLLGAQYVAILDQYLVLLIVWIFITNFRSTTDFLLRMQERFRWFATANVIENSSRLAMIVVLFFTHNLSVEMALASYVVSKVLSTIYTLPILKVVTLQGASFISMVKRYFLYIHGGAKWEVIRMVFGNLFSGIDQWIVGWLLGLETVALFSFAMSMNSFLAQALPFRQILAPILARTSSEAGSSSFVARRIAKYSTWMNALLLSASLVAVPLIVLLIVPKYMAAVPVLFVLMLNQFINAFSTSQGSLMYALREQKYLLGLSVFGTISSFTVLPLFTKWLGVYGAILESHLSSIVILALRERRLRARHGITTFLFRDLLVFDDYDKTILKRVWNKMTAR